MPTPEADETSWNLEELRESEFDARATFLVRDSPVPEGVQERARLSQPKNVITKEGVSDSESGARLTSDGSLRPM